MSIPNMGPEHADQGDPGGVETPRRGNPPLVYRDEPLTDDVVAATTRATAVTHRFGGVRYALTRPNARSVEPRPSAEDGDSDARD